MSMGEFITGLLAQCWRVFNVPLYQGLSAASILFGVLFITLLIWFLHTFFKRES